MTSSHDFITIKAKPKRRHRNCKYVIFQHGRNVAVRLPTMVEDRFSLVPGLDVAHFSVQGVKVIVTFSRK